ncbi:MAG: tetratricopeptide repeat protein, partial [Candidatus Margulisbacteria bacterium]|nr:tetratricopeptide repeat protein [Candidatus Margulisiibacteriota bacterium]
GAILLCVGESEKAVQILLHSRDIPVSSGKACTGSVVQKDYVANYLLGNVYLKQGEKKKAKQAFTLAIKCNETPEVSLKLRELQ